MFLPWHTYFAPWGSTKMCLSIWEAYSGIASSGVRGAVQDKGFLDVESSFCEMKNHGLESET